MKSTELRKGLKATLLLLEMIMGMAFTTIIEFFASGVCNGLKFEG